LPGFVIPRTAAYAAAQALHDLIVTDYRPVPPDWPDAHRLSIRRRRSSRRRSPCWKTLKDRGRSFWLAGLGN
jgi:hypothetical protein